MAIGYPVDDTLLSLAGFPTQGAVCSSLPPLEDFSAPKIWSESNRKISITIEIFITIYSP